MSESGLVVAPQPAVQLGTLRAQTPAALVTAATEMADALAAVIEKQKLYSVLSGKKYVKVEGWTTLGAMMGVTAHEVEVTEKDGAYTATVELRRMADNQPIARASAECGGKAEALWNNRAPYARRSMALTRATSKAARLAFSWVMTLAGYEATPAEEMDGVEPVKPAVVASGSVAEMAKAVAQKVAQKAYGPATAQDVDAEQVRTEPVGDTKLREFTYKQGEKKGQKGKLYVVTGASGWEATTFDEAVYQAASALIGGEPVRFVYKARKDRPDTFELIRVEPLPSAPLFEGDDTLPPF